MKVISTSFHCMFYEIRLRSAFLGLLKEKRIFVRVSCFCTSFFVLFKKASNSVVPSGAQAFGECFLNFSIHKYHFHIGDK